MSKHGMMLTIRFTISAFPTQTVRCSMFYTHLGADGQRKTPPGCGPTALAIRARIESSSGGR